MAMIYGIGIEGPELEQIAGFMRAGGEGTLPEVSALGHSVLEAVTSAQQTGLWRVVIGRFVEGSPYKRGDVLMDDKGKSTGRHGTVETDYEAPEAAYVIGVPF